MDPRDYLSGRQAAERLGYDYSYFVRKLGAGQVKGAFLHRGRWWVPPDITFLDVGIGGTREAFARAKGPEDA